MTLCEIPGYVDKESILSILNRENVVLSNLKVKRIDSSRFFSNLYLIESRSYTNKSLNFYVKCLPEDEKKCELTRAYLQFQNESALYQQIIPAFEEFQRVNCPGESLSPLEVPQCYTAQGNGKDCIIILKDMSTSGYVLLDRLQPLKLPELSSALKRIGRYHGFSLAMKIKAPEEFKKLTNLLAEPVYENPQYEDFYRGAMVNCLDDVHSMMKEFYDRKSIYLEKYKYFIDKALELLPSQVRSPTNEPYNVIIHGDIWINNMLFRYGEDGNEPDDICFLDFQQTRYCTPAIDICRVLFVIMDKAARDKHLDYLLRCYHEALSQTLTQFGLNPEYLFPFSEVQSQLKKFSAFIVVISIFTLTFGLGGEIETKQFLGDGKDELYDSLKGMNEISNIDVRGRVFEVIEEFVDLGYMDI